MFRGIIYSKWVQIGVLALFIVGGVSTSQAQEQPTPADLQVSDVAYELFSSSTMLIVINLTNPGGSTVNSGTGQLFVKSPSDEDFVALPSFLFGSIAPGGSTRASATLTVSDKPDGPYEIRVEVGTSSIETNFVNNFFLDEFTLIREPQFRPVEVQFSPPFFEPQFVSEISVDARIDNFGIQPSLNNGSIDVEFALCRIQSGESTCNDSAFSVFSTQTLDLFQTAEASGFASSTLVLNPVNEVRTREWQVSACLAVVVASASEGCSNNGGNLDAGTYIVRVSVDTNNVVAEVDENDNVVFARFTIPGAGGGGAVRITDMIVGINGEEARGMLWIVTDDSTLIGMDKRELERFGQCNNINLGTECPYLNDTQRLASINQFTTVEPNPSRVGFGTAIVDVFSSALINYDSQFVNSQGDPTLGKVRLVEDDFRPARITKIVQNRSRQILYVGLSDGNLVRYNFANPSNIIKNVLPLASGEIADLQIIDRGIYVGANEPNSNDPNAIGSILFVQEGTLSITKQSIVSGNIIRKVYVSPSSQVFISTEQTVNPNLPTLRMFWASSMVESGVITGQLESLQEAQLGTVFSGATWDDFVVNSRNRAFLSATDNSGQSRLFGYNFRRGFSGGVETLTPSLIFGPFVEFVDQCDQRIVTLGDVQFLELGDDTPDISADQVLHIGTDSTPRVLTLEIQNRNQFGIIQDVTSSLELLKWWVQMEGKPTSIKVDDSGEDRGRNTDGSVVFPNGRLFVTAENQTLNLINGVNRTCSTPNQLDDTLTTDAGVLAPVDTSGGQFFDTVTFLTQAQVTAFYAGNRLYMWLGALNDIGANTGN